MLYKRFTLLTDSIYDVVFDVDKIVDDKRVTIFAKRVSEPITSTQNVIDTVINRDKQHGKIKFETVVKHGDSQNHNITWCYRGNMMMPGGVPNDLSEAFYKLKAQLDRQIEDGFKSDGTQTLSDVLTVMGFAQYNG